MSESASRPLRMRDDEKRFAFGLAAVAALGLTAYWQPWRGGAHLAFTIFSLAFAGALALSARWSNRLATGTAELRSSSSLGLRSVIRLASPVIFPPGLARLVTWPVLTGSACTTKTMGIEDVAFFAGCTNMELRATIRSTLSRTKSAASSEPHRHLRVNPAAVPHALTEFTRVQIQPTSVATNTGYA